MNVKERQKIERRIVRSILTKAKKEGYTIFIHNGEETIKLSPLTSIKAMLEQCFSVDEEHIILKKDGRKFESIFFSKVQRLPIVSYRYISSQFRMIEM